jgi:hypothetical protein
MTTAATLPDREAEELEIRSGLPTKWSLAICKLDCRTVDVLLNKLCGHGVGRRADDCHHSSARLAHYGLDSGTAGLLHGSVREAIALAINMRNAAVSPIDATFVTSIAMTAAAYDCRSAAAFG